MTRNCLNVMRKVAADPFKAPFIYPNNLSGKPTVLYHNYDLPGWPESRPGVAKVNYPATGALVAPIAATGFGVGQYIGNKVFNPQYTGSTAVRMHNAPTQQELRRGMIDVNRTRLNNRRHLYHNEHFPRPEQPGIIESGYNRLKRFFGW